MSCALTTIAKSAQSTADNCLRFAKIFPPQLDWPQYRRLRATALGHKGHPDAQKGKAEYVLVGVDLLIRTAESAYGHVSVFEITPYLRC
jgi:hypothetical protein